MILTRVIKERRLLSSARTAKWSKKGLKKIHRTVPKKRFIYIFDLQLHPLHCEGFTIWPGRSNVLTNTSQYYFFSCMRMKWLASHLRLSTRPNFFPAIRSYCSRLSVVLHSISILIRLKRRTKFRRVTQRRPT